ncbi:hypothetical protein LJC71_02935 [Desulfosarcina sp. OttesenSCG-928-A07]|nr:hypothetical protein [Desulfosarcina sp. OttesenSCG-928-G17]MDL2328692.1 hypothetical protein [Desulfosarcina sp. OttesenSCG-928-A07]
MKKRSGALGWWVLALVLAAGLQAAFICADSKQTATEAAIDFSKAWLRLDPKMDQYLCDELRNKSEGGMIADTLYARTEDARLRGFDVGMARQSILHIETRVLAHDGDTATIYVKGTSRTCIHPVFTYVARLFRIGKIHTFEETLSLIKENSRWKICGAPYGLSVDL